MEANVAKLPKYVIFFSQDCFSERTYAVVVLQCIAGKLIGRTISILLRNFLSENNALSVSDKHMVRL